ncbi:Rho termination factor [Sphingomonas sp. LaA6.9]|uniref:DUF7218 family protein n=1 Tax=Sphingomonas sp. LaA6.9 TaxID=2919914 RepID=UPI001F4FB62C|nr:Rho termination factor [Sphingomonas sp. LaA6.9]MCJ8155864.1 Rho termination factor [Sphingomonas sp. LaA6.9]
MAREHGPTISDDMLFEALLKQGCSAEKAARIAHTHDPLAEWEEGAADRGASGGPTATKEDLVAALRKG